MVKKYKCNYDFCLFAVTDLGLVISAPGQPWTTRYGHQVLAPWRLLPSSALAP